MKNINKWVQAIASALLLLVLIGRAYGGIETAWWSTIFLTAGFVV